MSKQYCTNCGEPLEEDAHFCTSCGAEVNATSSPRRQKSRGKSQSGFLWLFLVGGAFLVIAGIWWETSSKTSALPTATAVFQQPTETTEIPYPNVTRATIEEVKTALDAGTAIVVDVRDLQYYQQAHIPGSISLSTDDLEAEYQMLPQDQMIYLYCTWPNEESSAGAASFLMQNGYTDVAAILGGLNAWADAGYPISTGDEWWTVYSR